MDKKTPFTATGKSFNNGDQDEQASTILGEHDECRHEGIFLALRKFGWRVALHDFGS